MDLETPQEQLPKSVRHKPESDVGTRKIGPRFILSQKPSKRAFSKRQITEPVNYKQEDVDRSSAKLQKSNKLGKSQVSGKQSSKELTNMFQKNFNYLVQSKNLKRKKREHRRNKLSEAMEFSAKYSRKC